MTPTELHDVEIAAEAHGLKSYSAWRRDVERRYDRGIPSWWYSDSQSQEKYLGYVASAIKWQADQDAVARGHQGLFDTLCAS